LTPNYGSAGPSFLAGYVTKQKVGRKNHYFINIPAVEGLLQADVTIKHTPSVTGVSTNTPSVEGVYTPAVAGNTPRVADNTPSVAGANSSVNNTTNNTRDRESAVVADAPTASFEDLPKRNEELEIPTLPLAPPDEPTAPLGMDGWDDEGKGIWIPAPSSTLSFLERQAQKR